MVTKNKRPSQEVYSMLWKHYCGLNELIDSNIPVYQKRELMRYRSKLKQRINELEAKLTIEVKGDFLNSKMMRKFKQGDWCFHEFELSEVKKVKFGKVTEVSNGYTSTISIDLTPNCFPLNMKIKRDSETVSYWYDKILKLNLTALNIPDIHRALVSKWVDICEADDNEELLDKLWAFVSKIINLKDDRLWLDGVKIYK